MEIYLMQHGASYSQDVNPEQPLSSLGKEQVEKSASAMRKMGLAFDAVFASPKKRSVQTAEIVARTLGFPVARIVQTDTLTPNASAETFLGFLLGFDKAKTVFVAGHMPSLQEIASRLLTPEYKAHLAIENAGLTRLDAAGPDSRNALLRLHMPAALLHLLA